MKFLTLLAITILLATSGLESDMKFREAYTVDIGLQTGIPIYDTSQGWLLAASGDGKFANRICKLDESGKVLWYKNFAYKPISMIPDVDGAVMLDQYGNFYRIDSSGSVTANLMDVVVIGKNVITSGDDSFYASGADDSVTCFQLDGNISWVAMGKSEATSLFYFDGNLIVSEKDGAIVSYNESGEENWRMQVDGFAISEPVVLSDTNLVWGLRNTDASMGKIIAITPNGKKSWESPLKKGVNNIFNSNKGYLATGPLYSAGVDTNGKLIWEKSFDGFLKIFPLGFNGDDRFILGILNSEDKSDSFEIVLLDSEGEIEVACKIPVEKNSLVNASLRGRLLMLGMKDKITVFRLLTRKEFIEGIK